MKDSIWKKYEITYRVKTASGSYIDRYYECNDRNEFAACIALNDKGAIRILTVNGIRYEDWK